jgi:hypothetical protein
MLGSAVANIEAERVRLIPISRDRTYWPRRPVTAADHSQHDLIPLLSHTHLPHIGSVTNQPK